MSVSIKIKTAFQLGLMNLSRVFIYRLGVKTGINPIKKINTVIVTGPFFRLVEINKNLSQLQCIDREEELTFRPFGWREPVRLNEVDWLYNYLSGERVSNGRVPWYQIPDFSSGDIKGIWEASRFDWTLKFAQRALIGDSSAISSLNDTLTSWINTNSLYLGPNWKCGQEASIRVIHLAMTARLLKQVSHSEPGLLSLIRAHLARIAPTISYAMAQDNNHGTSEAAALFIGGSWLCLTGEKQAQRWMNQGRRWLENRARRLIETDGSFSQYSTNYHRVLLDTFSIVELWRRDLKLSEFSTTLYSRMHSATIWLYQLIQTESGDVPNLGANDGARLLPLSDTDYRDFRPSVQLASVLFCDATAWPEAGVYDDQIKWLEITKPTQTLAKPSSFHCSKGGYMGLRSSDGLFAFMRYPKFRFRPSQCDALHVDLWVRAQNVFRDGGTYSYNAGQSITDYYGGSVSHNTIQFDDHDSMPRISRFLLGSWLKASEVEFSEERSYCKASYKDYLGCYHRREMELSDSSLKVTDYFSGARNKSVLRWRLMPGNWTFTDKQELQYQNHCLRVWSDSDIRRIELVAGCESRYYYHQAEIPVLEIELDGNGKITTEYLFIL